jgi:hypothetical protein
MDSGMLSVKLVFASKTRDENGRVHVSMAYKMTPHDQSSNENVIELSNGGEYAMVPPIT